MQSHSLQSSIVPDQLDLYFSLRVNYDKNDNSKLNDNLLFTFWHKLFFDGTAPCYISNRYGLRADEMANAFVFSIIGLLNTILEDYDHNYRLVPVDNKITKLVKYYK